MPVSVVIVALNDEPVIRECLASCGWCDDVHVVDGGSSDRTAQIGREHGAHVHVRPGLGSEFWSEASRDGVPADLPTKYLWVFRLNADECFTPRLAGAVRTVVLADPPQGEFRVPEKLMYLERWLKRAGEYPQHRLRLVNRARPPGGPAGTIDEPFLHFGLAKGVYDWLDRHNRQTDAQARQVVHSLREKRPPGAAIRPRNAFLSFLASYFLKGGFLDGRPGLTYCVLEAYHQYQVAIKVRELLTAPPSHGLAEVRVTSEPFVYGSAAGRVPESGAVSAAPGRVWRAERGMPSPPEARFGALVKPGQRVIVTGGSGFIGTNLVDFYRRAGAEVINIDCQPPRDPAHQSFWRNVNICQAEPYNRIVRDFEPELFFHLAARTDLDETRDVGAYAANSVGVENTLRALEGSRSLRKIIITSSQLVCRPGYTPKNEEDYAPHTIYGQSKILTERITRAWKNAPCPWTLIRPTSIWGPWFHIPYKTFFLAVAERKYMHQRGVNPIRSFGFVSNGVYEYARMVLAEGASVDRRTFYLADAEPVRVREWADMVQREMGVAPLREMPLGVLTVAAKVGDVLQFAGWKDPPLTSFRLRNLTGDNTCDMAPVSEIIGSMPYTVEEGVKVTVDWMRQEGSIPWRGG